MTSSGKDPFIGKRIREYEILEVLGKGGMGAVYRARHVLLDEERAVKVVQSRLAGDKEFVDRFIREAKILTRLRHPNLVHLFEFSTLEEDVFFMVLEFLHGESVIDRIHRKKRIPVDEAIRIVQQAADGLHSAHQKGIIHRDISPDNLLIIKDDTGAEITKVIDFGIAKPNFESTHPVTVTNLFLGKPEYCSPEQCGVLEEAEIIDRRSDIYSLGITMYHMIAGKLPFYSKTPQGYLLKHATEIPKPLSSHFSAGEIPAELDRIVLKALSKKREERHKTMDEFARELAQIRSSESPTVQSVRFEGSTALLDPGDLFASRYLIEKKLGEGGMGIVYKAIDKILGEPVALKIMSEKVIGEPRTLERFKREVILARRVAHSNACKIYDIGESRGVHYVSMQFLKGTTLAEMIGEQGPLSPEVGLVIIRGVLQALQEAHRVGVIHRDLKPQNIMVDSELNSFIMDFGISISKDVSRMTQTGALMGTPAYMAPEQFEGTNVDHRTDIYSIGVIMYEMFTGRLPFDAESPMAIIFAHLKSTVPKPSEIVPGFPEDLEKIIIRTLEKEVENRYQNVRELLGALEPLTAATTTESFRIQQELVVHKLLAERNYSKAIKLLHTLLKTSPENKDWRKLLNIAVSEKVQKDLRRARSLIRKKKLIQAQLLIEKASRLSSGTGRVVSQIRRLEEILNKKRQQSVDHYLGEAENALAAGDWSSAAKNLEAASNLKTNDPRITPIEERIVGLQQEAVKETLLGEVAKAEKLFSEGNFGDALAGLEQILEEHPEFEPAQDLRNQILEKKRFHEEQRRIYDLLIPVFHAMQTGKMDEATSLLENVATDIEPNLGSWLGRTRGRVKEIAVAFSKGAFEAVLPILDTVLADDPYGWLAENSESFTRLSDIAKQAESRRREFQSAFEEGRRLFDSSKWEEAIRVWKSAEKILPEDKSVQQWIAAANQRLESNRHIRTQLIDQLAQSERLIQSQKLEQAQEMLEQIHEATSQYHLAGFEKEVGALKTRLNEKIQEGNSRRSKGLESARKFIEKRELQKATEKVDELLRLEPSLKDALQLRNEIETSIREKERQAQHFKSTFEKGKAHFENRLWKEAIQCWKEALQLAPDDAATIRWIKSAESRAQIESEIRTRVTSESAKAETLIKSGKFDEAEEILKVCSGQISPEYVLEDLAQRCSALQTKLEVVRKEKARLNRIEKEMGMAQKLFDQDQFEEARKSLQSLIKQEGVLDEAIALLSRIDRKIEEKAATATLLNEAFEKGKKWFDKLNWKKSVEVWREEEKVVAKGSFAEWIAAAEERNNIQNEIRVNAKSLISQTEALIKEKNFDEASNLLAEVEKQIVPGYDLADVHIQLSKLKQNLAYALQQEATRQQRINQDLTEATRKYKSDDLKQALQKVENVLKQEPQLVHALNLQKEIQDKIRGRQELEHAIRNSIRSKLNEVDRLIIGKDFEKAQGLLEKCRQSLSSEFPLEDLQETIDGAARRLGEEQVKQQQRTEAIDRQLELAREGYENGSYHDALRGTRELLNQEPGQQEALRLQARIESALQLMEDVTRVVELLFVENLQELPRSLQKMKATSKSTNLEKDASDVAEKISAAISSLQSGDLRAAQRSLEAVLIHSKLLKQHESQLMETLSRLEERERREAVFAGLFQKGLQDFQQKRWMEATKAFEKLDENFPGNAEVQKYIAISKEKVQEFSIPVLVEQRIKRDPYVILRRFWWAALPVVLVALFVAVWFGVKPAPTDGFVVINALPWARVKITPVSEGIHLPEIPEKERITPCYLALPPGQYRVELENGGIFEPVTQKVVVEPGKTSSLAYSPKEYDPEIIFAEVDNNE